MEKGTKVHLLLPRQMWKLRPREARDSLGAAQGYPVNCAWAKLQIGEVERAWALPGLLLTSYGPSHKPLSFTGPPPRVKTEVLKEDSQGR